MPQTREHWAVCELIGVERGLVVLTKLNLVDEEMLALAEEDVRDLLAGGPLAQAPIMAASAKTGAGLEAVRETLRGLVVGGLARRDGRRPARLFVDRCFVQRGFGAIVTGTWSGWIGRTSSVFATTDTSRSDNQASAGATRPSGAVLPFFARSAGMLQTYAPSPLSFRREASRWPA